MRKDVCAECESSNDVGIKDEFNCNVCGNVQDVDVDIQIDNLKKELSKAKADNLVLCEALEFYASEKSWYDLIDTYNPSCMGTIGADDLTFNVIENGTIMKMRYQHGGKKARAALAKIDGKKEGEV